MDIEDHRHESQESGAATGGYPPIGQCPAHRKLLDWAAGCGLDNKSVRDFLWRIRAPRDLLCLARVSERINLILKSAVSVWGISLAEYGLDEWPHITDLIAGQPGRSLLKEMIGPDFDLAPKSEDDNVFAGTELTYWAPYPTLWNDHASEDNRYQLLQAHLLFAFATDVKSKTSMAGYEACRELEFIIPLHKPYEASKAIRDLSEGPKEAIDTLEKLSPVEGSPFTFARGLRATRYTKNHENQGWLTQAIVKIRNYLELVYGLRPLSTGRRSGHANSRGKTIHGHVSLDARRWDTGINETDPFDPFDWDVRYTSTATTSLLEGERNECVQRDECPYEYENSEELVHTDLGDEDAQNNPSGYETIVGGASTHIEMANQLLWFAYNVPTAHEIAKFFENSFGYVRSVVKQVDRNRTKERREANQADKQFDVKQIARRLDSTQIGELEAIILGVTMAATGASLQRACGLKVYESATTDIDVDLALVLDSNEARAWWRVHAPLPDYKNPQTSEKLTPIVTLPDLVHAGYLVRLLIGAMLRPEAASGPRSLFTDNPAAYAATLQRRLFEVDPSERLTIAKLPNFVFAHLVREATGDVADGCFASAHWHNLAWVPTYYATPSLRRIRQLYVNTAGRMRDLIRPALRTLTSSGSSRAARVPRRRTSNVLLPTCDLRVGNHVCPSRDIARAAMTSIKKEMKRLGKYPEPLDPIRLHNFYTLYVLEFFAASVGIRGVTTPYLGLDEVDKKTGFAVLTEKTIRPVWLPPKMVLQMELYHDYLRAYARTRPIPKGPDGRPAPCFLLDDRENTLLVTPTVKTQYLRRYAQFNYAASIFRRFIRNELRESGCPGQVAEAWLSHASRGEEIYHKYSQFSLGAYRQALQYYLVPILDDLRFDPWGPPTCLLH